MLSNLTSEVLAEKILAYCLTNKKKFIYISGNGGSGKTEFSKVLARKASLLGNTSIISTDDFVVDTSLRDSATLHWLDSKGEQHTSRATTSFEQAYFLRSLRAIIYNLREGNNYYHLTKKAGDESESVLLRHDAILTIIEGVGSVYLDKQNDDTLAIFLECSSELELQRRIERKQGSKEQDEMQIKSDLQERRDQYEAIIEPHKEEYELVLESLEDYSLSVVKDIQNILT